MPDKKPGRKLTTSQELRIYQLSGVGLKLEQLAVQFGVHPNTIRNILRRLKDLPPGPRTHDGLINTPETTGRDPEKDTRVSTDRNEGDN